MHLQFYFFYHRLDISIDSLRWTTKISISNVLCVASIVTMYPDVSCNIQVQQEAIDDDTKSNEEKKITDSVEAMNDEHTWARSTT